MENLKSSLFIIGNLLVFFSIYSFIPGVVDYVDGGTDWVVFFVISIVCLFTGLNVSFIFQRKDKDVEEGGPLTLEGEVSLRTVWHLHYGSNPQWACWVTPLSYVPGSGSRVGSGSGL